MFKHGEAVAKVPFYCAKRQRQVAQSPCSSRLEVSAVTTYILQPVQLISVSGWVLVERRATYLLCQRLSLVEASRCISWGWRGSIGEVGLHTRLRVMILPLHYIIWNPEK